MLNVEQLDKIIRTTLDIQAKICATESMADQYINQLILLDPSRYEKIKYSAIKAHNKSIIAGKKRRELVSRIVCLTNAELLLKNVTKLDKDMTLSQLFRIIKNCKNKRYDFLYIAQVIRTILDKDALAYEEFKNMLYNELSKKDTSHNKYEYTRRYLSYLI